MNAPQSPSLPERPLRALSPTEIVTRLARHPGWRLNGDGADICIEKSYAFTSYGDTMAFVNAVAFVARRRDHHPELVVRPHSCVVRFNTHDVKGLSERDFDAATQVDALLDTDPAGNARE